ncbi:hypothetical protein L904_01165 [Agrobacterium sp. LY4]|nr:hypothetical protein L904_01165 [Agrobacterium sp. LY4]
MGAADEVGVLALPAETGGGGKRFFHYRCGIDKDFHILTGARGKTGGDFLQPPLDDVVIITIAGIDRDGSLVGFGKQAARIFFRTVVQPEHDDGAHVSPERFRLCPAGLGFLHPRHRAVIAIVEKLSQPFGCERHAVRRGDATQIEAERKRFLTNEVRQFMRAYSLLFARDVDGRLSRGLFCGIYNACRPKVCSGFGTTTCFRYAAGHSK